MCSEAHRDTRVLIWAGWHMSTENEKTVPATGQQYRDALSADLHSKLYCAQDQRAREIYEAYCIGKKRRSYVSVSERAFDGAPHQGAGIYFTWMTVFFIFEFTAWIC